MTAPAGELRFAMVGCGGRARVHAPVAASRNDFGIASWLDTAPEKAAELAGQYGGGVASSWEAVLTDGTLDGVVVALPHDLHHEYGMAALRAGKHVMMEIPIAATPAESREMTAAADKAGLVLLVLHSLRFWESHRLVARIVASGEVGAPIFLRYHNEHTVPDDYFALQPGHFAAEAGVLHHGDIVRWWGGEVSAVTARGLSIGPTARQHGTFDHITVLYDIAGGALAETTCSWVTRTCPQNRFIRGSVTCTKGSVALTYDDEIRLFSPDRKPEDGERYTVLEPDGPNRPAGEITHFADCIRGSATPVISPQDALHALQLALAARESARENRRVVLA